MPLTIKTKNAHNRSITHLNGTPPPVRSLFDVVVPPSAATLSEVEKATLVECESRIAKGWSAFLDVGDALLTVRAGRLYRSEFETFEEYCRVKCSYGRAHSYRLMAAAEVVKHLSPCGDILPTTEAQVRPLLGLPPEELKSAWKSVIAKAGKNPVTTRVIKEAVAPFRKTKEKVKRIPLNLTLLDLIAKLKATLKDGNKEAMALIAKLEGGIRKFRGSKQQPVE